MKKHETYSSGWLKAEEHLLNNGIPTQMVLTIKNVESHQFDDGNKQRTLSFNEIPEKLGLNVTNWDACAGITGQDDDDHWPGHQICVYAEKVRFGPKMVWGVRIKPPGNVAAPVTQPATQQPQHNTDPSLEPVGTVGKVSTRILSIEERGMHPVNGVATRIVRLKTEAGDIGCFDLNIIKMAESKAGTGEEVEIAYIVDKPGRRATDINLSVPW